MRLLTNESEKLTTEKREELITLLGKLDGTSDRELTIDNAILRYAESRVGYARLAKKTGASKRKQKAPAETTVAEVAQS